MKARIGNLVKVKNQSKKHSEKEFYYTVILKDASKFTNFIFTEAEIHTAYDRAIRNAEDCLERSFISHVID